MGYYNSNSKGVNKLQVKTGSNERTFEFPDNANLYELEIEIMNIAKAYEFENVSIRYVGGSVMPNDYSYHSLEDVKGYFKFLSEREKNNGAKKR